MAKTTKTEPEQTIPPGELLVGQCYLVRTGTRDDHVGRLAAVHGFALTLTGSAWIADSGKWSVFIREGRAPNMEVEPEGEITLQWSHYQPWPHPLFTEAE